MNSDQTAHFWGWMLLFVCAIWGLQFSLIALSLQDVGPLSFNFLRFALASLCLTVPLLMRPRTSRIPRGQTRHGIVLGVFLFGGFATQTIGIGLTTASNAGFITGLNTVLVPVFAWVLLREAMHGYIVLAVLMGFGGTAMLSGGIDGFGLGEFWVLLCAFSFALHIVLTGRYTRGGDALYLAWVQMITVTLLALISAGLAGESIRTLPHRLLGSQQASLLWLSIVLGAVIGSAFGYYAQTVAQKYLAAWRVGVIYATEPLFGAVAAFFILGERLVALAWVGAALIIFAMLIAELAAPDKRPALTE